MSESDNPSTTYDFSVATADSQLVRVAETCSLRGVRDAIAPLLSHPASTKELVAIVARHAPQPVDKAAGKLGPASVDDVVLAHFAPIDDHDRNDDLSLRCALHIGANVGACHSPSKRRRVDGGADVPLYQPTALTEKQHNERTALEVVAREVVKDISGAFRHLDLRLLTHPVVVQEIEALGNDRSYDMRLALGEALLVGEDEHREEITTHLRGVAVGLHGFDPSLVTRVVGTE